MLTQLNQVGKVDILCECDNGKNKYYILATLLNKRKSLLRNRRIKGYKYYLSIDSAVSAIKSLGYTSNVSIVFNQNVNQYFD